MPTKVSDAFDSSTDSTRPDPVVDSERIEEGFLQLDLGFRWTRYLLQGRHVSKGHPDRKLLEEPLRQLHQAVLNPFIEVEWLPGLKEFLALYLKAPEKIAQHITPWTSRLSEACDDYVKKFKQVRSVGRPTTTHSLRCLLFESLRVPGDLRDDPALPPPGLPVSKRASAWLYQAEAIANWRVLLDDLLIKLEPDRDLRKKFDELERTSNDLTQISGTVRARIQPKASTGAILELIDLIKCEHEAIQELRREFEHSRSVQTTEWSEAFGNRPGFDPASRRTIERTLNDVSASWPPLLLTHLFEDNIDRLVLKAGEGLAGILIRRMRSHTDFGKYETESNDARTTLAFILLDELTLVQSQRPITGSFASNAAKSLGLLLRRPGEVTVIGDELPDGIDPATARADVPVGKGVPLGVRKLGIVSGGVVLRKAERAIPSTSRYDDIKTPLRTLQNQCDDPKLAELSRKMLDAIPNGNCKWPDGVEQVAILWNVVARATLAGSGQDQDLAAAAFELRAALKQLGWQIVEAEPGNAIRSTDWIRILASSRVDRRRPIDLTGSGRTHGFAFALKSPDGDIILPTTWLGVPVVEVAENPFLGFLADEGTGFALQELWQHHFASKSPSLGGWIRSIAFNPPPDVQSDIAAQLFRELLNANRELQAAVSPMAVCARDLAKRIYQLLDDHAKGAAGIPFTAELGVDLAKLASDPSLRVDIFWQPEFADGNNSYADDYRLGTKMTAASIWIRPGRSISPKLLEWARLPEPDQSREPTAANLFLEFIPWLRRAPLRPDLPIKVILDKIASKLMADADSLTLLIEEVRRDRESAARQWWPAIQAIFKNKPLYPSLDDLTVEVLWPKDLAPSRNFCWKYSTADRGKIVPGEKLRFSFSLENATATFSLGREGDLPILDDTLILDTAVSSIDGCPTIVSESVRNWLQEIMGAIATGEQPHVDIETAKNRLLLLLRAMNDVRERVPAVNDKILAAIRAWAAGRRISILPKSWVFSSSIRVEALDADEVEISRIQRFDDNSGSVGSVVLLEFGIEVPGASRTRSRVAISAGKAPVGYDRLRSALVEFREATPPPSTAALRALDDLLAKLDNWPNAATGDYLRADVVMFQTEYYDQLEKSLRSEGIQRVQPIAAAITTVLTKGLGLECFEPKTHREFPDNWIEARNYPPYETGRIGRVYRPGIRTVDGRLVSPAQVDIE